MAEPENHRDPAGQADASSTSGARRRRTSRAVVTVAVLAAVVVAAVVAGLLPWRTSGGGPGAGVVPPAKTNPPREGSLEAILDEAEALKKEALAVASGLLVQFPASADALAVAGNVHGALGNTAEATKLWEKCLDVGSGRSDACAGLARVAQKKGDHQAAEKLWRRALEIRPDMASACHGLGLALMAQGKTEEAARAFEKETALSPESSEAHFLLGQAALQLQRHAEARASYEKAVKIDPAHTNAYYGLAAACARLGDAKAAAAHRKKFQELKAEDMLVLKDRNEARDDLKALRQSAAETLASAGRVYRANGNPRRAEVLWSRAAALDPANTTCRLELAAHYLAANRLPEALGKYEELSALEPWNSVHHLNAGLIHARQKRYDDAEVCFRKALELQPESAWACRDLAQLYLTVGKNLPEAMRLASKAVELEPTAQNHFILSWACDKSGDVPAALAAIRKALDLEPQNQKYVRVHEDLRSRK